MNIRALFEDFKNDTRAVSPVVATLVLIVVAITGASGIALLQGQFASEVAEDQNTKELGVSASTELMIAGSTTVQPVSELLAEAYMKAHAGTKVTVQGGGSGAGITSVAMDIVDIGAASRDVNDKEIEKYSDLDTYKIGGSAVVMIGNPTISGYVAHADLKTAYKDNDPGAITSPTNLTNGTVPVTLYQRSEESGTEDTFTGWLGTEINAGIEGLTGNAGMLSKVQTTPGAVGFVDFGFADTADPEVVIIGIYDKDGKHYDTVNITSTNLTKELSGTADTYPDKLARPLNYITNGYPSVMEQGFIDFARLPESAIYFEKCGYFPIVEIA